MLILSRRVGETIIMPLEDGRDIEITVSQIRGDKVRLSINAPREIDVHRLEVWAAIQRKRREDEPPSDPTSPTPSQ